MPVYEFKCECCEGVFDYPIHIEDRDLERNCEVCGNTLTRSVGCNGFILKGRGWAKDGYSKDLQINDKDA